MRFWTVLVLLTGFFAIAGCRREEIQVYRVPKETGAPPLPIATSSSPQLRWKAPADWEEKPAEKMRVASFAIHGENGAEADASIIPLPRALGTELENVNRWRGQLKLKPIAAAELTALTETVAIGTQQGKLFDLVSDDPIFNGKQNARIVAAILPRGETNWFFKLMGEDALVQKQKPAFLQFLQTIAFPEEGRISTTHPPVSTNLKEEPKASHPIWNVPSTWKEQPASAMRVANFLISQEEGQAEVSVSVFPGDTGGALANVNRWRGQLGLAPIDETELGKQATSITPNDPRAIMVEISGVDARKQKPSRLVGAIVPKGDQTWFYKLMGPEAVVDKEKAAFQKFVQTVNYEGVVSTP